MKNIILPGSTTKKSYLHGFEASVEPGCRRPRRFRAFALKMVVVSVGNVLVAAKGKYVFRV